MVDASDEKLISALTNFMMDWLTISLELSSFTIDGQISIKTLHLQGGWEALLDG